MIPPEPQRLTDRLRQCAEQWVEANTASLATLGRLAIGDSSYFSRPEAPRGPTTGTLENFARFLGDSANWPDCLVPDDVAAFAHVVGVSPAAGAPATGQFNNLSGIPAEQDAA